MANEANDTTSFILQPTFDCAFSLRISVPLLHSHYKADNTNLGNVRLKLNSTGLRSPQDLSGIPPDQGISPPGHIRALV